MSEGFPVYAVVGNNKVRVGTAHKHEDGFSVAFGGLSIGGTPDAAPTPRRAPSGDSGAGGAVFPNYGRSKGAPVRGASIGDLEFYANGCRRSLADDAKQRWWPKEQALLDAIEAEIHRQNGGEGREPARNDGPAVDDSDLSF